MDGQRWPNLFLAGAAKAGTTSLHRYLDEHPDIVMSLEKETYFFTDTLDEVSGDPEATAEAESAYLELFAHARDEAYVGESTPGYLWHPDVPGRIEARVDEPRFIVSLRDPIERAHSDWAMAVQRSGETRSFTERVRDELEGGIEAVPPGGVVDPGRYGTHLQRFLDRFGRDRVHPILFEHLKRDPLSLLEEIAAFLDVDVEAMEQVDYETVHNPYGEPRNRLAAWMKDSGITRTLAQLVLPERTRVWLGEHVLVENPEKPPMEDEARRMLADVYEPEVRKVEELMGRKVPELRRNWPTTGTPAEGR